MVLRSQTGRSSSLTPGAPRSHRQSGRGRDIGRRVFLVTIAGWALVPTTVQTVVAPKYFATVANVTARSPAAQILATMLTALVFLCALFAIREVLFERLSRRSIALLVAVEALPLYLLIRSIYAGENLSGQLFLLAVTIGIWSIRNLEDVERLMRGYTVTLAVLSLIIGIVLPARGTLVNASGSEILLDKTSVFGSLLLGPLSHPNTLGQVLVLGLPFVFVRSAGWRRWLFAALVLIALLWTGSRTSLNALGVAVLVYLVIRIVPPALRPGVLVSSLAVVIGLTVGVPLATTSPAAFSGRGQIWIGSLEAVRGSEIFGLGPNWYVEVAQVRNQLIAEAFHGHNLFLTVFVTCGIVGVSLLAFMIVGACVAVLRRRSEPDFLRLVWLLVTLLSLGVLEYPFNFVDPGALLLVGWVPLVAIVSSIGSSVLTHRVEG